MLASEAHPLCRSHTIFLIAFAVGETQTSSGPFVMVALHYASRYLGWKGADLYTDTHRQTQRGCRTGLTDALWPYEAGV